MITLKGKNDMECKLRRWRIEDARKNAVKNGVVVDMKMYSVLSPSYTDE